MNTNPWMKTEYMLLLEGRDKRGPHASVTNRGMFFDGKFWFEGCGFNPAEKTFRSEAKAKSWCEGKMRKNEEK